MHVRVGVYVFVLAHACVHVYDNVYVNIYDQICTCLSKQLTLGIFPNHFSILILEVRVSY